MDSGKDLTDKDLILKSISQEVRYLSENVFQQKIEAQMIADIPLLKGRQVVLWWYKMPPGSSTQVEAQVFLSTVYGQNLVGLSMPQFSGQKFSDTRKKLLKTMLTISQPARPTDLCN